MSKVNFDFTADNNDFRNKVRQVQKDLADTKKQTAEAAGSMTDSFKKIGAAVGVAFGTAQLVSFAKQVATVRGEFQQLEVAYTTMLGSKEKADKLMQQSIEFAATTPFDVQSVASGAKQLLAYGSAASDVIDEMRMLGNIAAGLSIPLNDMVYLFGTTRTQGRMYTQDLRQFMGRGIPLAEELAKQFGVTKDKVGELVTEGKVGFDEMAKALKSMTSEGGQFYQLMDAQSKTIAGQISNLEDAVQQMFNKIGQNSEGFISKVLSGASFVVENYEKVGKVLLSAVAAWGTYKAAVIAVAAANKLTTFAENIKLIAMFRKELGLATAAQQAFNLASKSNVYVALASVLLTTAGALITFRKELFGSKGAMAGLKDATEEYNKSIIKEQTEIDSLFAKLNAAKKGTQEYDNAKKAIFDRYGDYLAKLGDEKTALDNVALAYRTITTEAQKAASARAIERATEIAADNYVEKRKKALEDLKDLLDKTYGDEKDANGGKKSEVYYLRLKPVVEGYEQADAELNDIISTFTRIDPYAGMHNAIDDITDRLAVQRGEMQKTIQTAEEMYGVINSGDLQVGPQPAPKKDDTTPKPTVDPDAAKKAAEARRKVSEAEQKAVQESNDRIADIETEGANKREEMRIKAIKNTSQKVQQQLEHDYNKEVELARISYDRAIRDEEQRQREAYKSLHNGSDEGFVKQDNEITANLRKELDARVKMAAEIYNNEIKAETEARNKAEKEAMDAYLSEYGAYQDKRLAITRIYARKIAEAQTLGERSSLEAERDNLLRGLDVKYNGDYIKIFSDASKMAKGQLVEALKLANEKLEEMKENGKESTEDYKNLQEQVSNLSDALRDMSEIDFGATWSDVAKVINDLVKDTSEFQSITDITSKRAVDLANSIARGREKLKSMIAPAAINGFTGGLAKAAESMREIADASGDIALEKSAEGLEHIASSISTIVSGVASGGLAGGFLSIFSIAVNDAIKSETEAAVATAKLAAANLEYANSIELINIKTKETKSLFGDNTFANSSNNWKAAQKAMAKYSDALSEIIDKAHSIDKSRERQLTDWAYNATLLDADIWKEKAMWNLTVDGWKQVSGNYVIDIEKARAYMKKMNDDMSDAAKAELEQMIALQEAYDSAMDKADSALKSFTGSLSTSLADAVWDGLVAGGDDAWSKWEEIGADAVANIGKQMLAEMIMDQYLDSYSDKLRAALGQEDAAMAMSEVVAEIVNGFPQMFDAIGTAATEYKDKMDELGIDLNASQRTGATGATGITATQESVDKQSGILTSIQGFTYNIDEKLTEAARQRALQTEYQSRITSTLADIASDTRRIAALETALGGIRSAINDIVLHGVTIK